MKVSFDFDSCLSEDDIQKIAGVFIQSPLCQTFIITSRSNNEFCKNTDLFKIANNLGIKKENIHFTDGDFKWRKIKELGITFHFDDMEDEVHLINANGGCAFLYNFDVQMTKWLLDDLDKGLLQINDINPKKI
jgi:hypothetical protein